MKKAKRSNRRANKVVLRATAQTLRAKGITNREMAKKTGYSFETMQSMLYRDSYPVTDRALDKIRSLL